MPFPIPMVWRQPTDHVSDCYVCLASITGVTVRSKHTVQYSNLPFAMRPLPHNSEIHVPKPPTNMTLSDSESSDDDVGQANNNMGCNPTVAAASSSNEPHLLTQGDLNDIVRDLNLSKKQAEILGPMLKGWILLRQDTKVCFTTGTMKNSRIFSPWKMVLCFAMMFVLLWKFLTMNINQISGPCSLIRQVSLKLVLLHNGNRFPSVLLAHAANMK